MKKNKGFTLVELLVAVAILGILTLLALTIISRVQQNNDNSKYEKYSETLVSSAKLYVDSYSIDMFGYDEDGCVDIPYEELEEKNLLKDLQAKDVTCSNPEDAENTYIRVKKTGDKYEFQESIKCVDKKGNIVYEKTIDESNSICNKETITKNAPTVTFTPNTAPANYIRTGSTTVKITIQDTDDGLAANNSLMYAIVLAKPDGTPPNANTITNWAILNYENPPKEKDPISKIITLAPQNQNDTKYYLFVKGFALDYTGNSTNAEKIMGAFKFDNVPPKCSDVTSIKASTTDWTNKDITFSMNFSPDIKKYQFGTKTKSKNTDSYPDNYTYNPASPKNVTDKTSLKISSTGYTKTTLRVYDAAGNKSDCNIDGTYKIDKTAPTLKISVYKRTSSGTSTGKAIKTVTANNTNKTQKLELTNWLNKSNYPNGIIYKVETSDNIGIKTKKLVYNKSGLKENSKKLDNYVNEKKGETTFYFNTDGVRKGKYTVTDNAGNSVNISFMAKLDKTAPEKPSITNGSKGNCTTKSFTVKATSSDAMSGKSYWQYKFGSDGKWNKLDKSSDFSLKISKNRTANMYIRVVDKAGNASSSSKTKINKKSKCVTYPLNSCNIRGNKIRKANTTWVCNGHHHSMTTYYQAYCSDKNGKLTKSGWVCTVAPLGEDQGWTVIND